MRATCSSMHWCRTQPTIRCCGSRGACCMRASRKSSKVDFGEIAESQPELLARHYTKADLIEKSARLWGKAGLRSQQRSALVEAAEQLGHALAQIETLPSAFDLRREQIILQVALLNTLMHVKGYGAPETKAAVAEVRALIDQAERLGESPDDPSLVPSALFGQWI